jgi:hypothetical protein
LCTVLLDDATGATGATAGVDDDDDDIVFWFFPHTFFGPGERPGERLRVTGPV